MKNPFKRNKKDPLKLREVELIHRLEELTEMIPVLIKVMLSLDENIEDLARQMEQLNLRQGL